MTRRSMHVKLLRIGVLALLVVCIPRRAPSYALSGNQWPDGNIVMQLQLGGGSGTLIDGSTSWGQSAEAALAIWNTALSRVDFRIVRDSNASVANGNGLSNVFWSSTAYGKAFDDFATPTQKNGISALTYTWITSGRLSEGDVIFRNTLLWNSYRGATRTSNGAVLIDFRRTAIHEFGHVLGLQHPNDNGQNVVAIMNSTTGNLDTLAGDDIAGAEALYGAAPPPPPPGPPSNVVVSFPPRNESLDFRNQLEAKYRDGLHRGGTPTYVNNEGDVVWIQEYLRYRVNQCSHATSVNDVMTEIDGRAAPAVCGSASAGQVNFPPRNESLSFRTDLEAKYRDGLKAAAGSSSVDNEGAVVWIQEYLRYRVNACTHADSVQRVFLQIDGRGIQPTCR